MRDPLILDLDGDGIETIALDGSNVHFDYDGDGFAERTGWAAADDGMLAFDANGNGIVDGMHELFGSPTQDGFEVLETLDSNNDGVIDSADTRFADLRVWRDLDQDGVTDGGELLTLAEAGVASISLTRTDVAGTTNGHDIGFGALFTRTDGSTGTAQTIYFATDRQDTVDPTPAGFVPAEGVEALPLLPGSGAIFSMAYALSNDATLRADWTALTDNAATVSSTELSASFEDLMLRWAGVDTIDPTSRGYYVDARHLAFVEAYFGETYQEQTLLTGEISTVPTTMVLGARIEGGYQELLDVLEVMFLAQTVRSSLARATDPTAAMTAALENPYFAYALLDFRTEIPEGETPSDTPGNLGMVVDLIKAFAPTEFGDAALYYEQALAGLAGMRTVAFDSSQEAYAVFMAPLFDDIADPHLRQIATELGKSTALIGTTGHEGLAGTLGDDVFIGGAGDDAFISNQGNDIFIYSSGDGFDRIDDRSLSTTETDVLVLRDLTASEITLTRVRNDLLIKVTATGESIEVNDFFWQFETYSKGVELIRFADGSAWGREDIQQRAVLEGSPGSNVITDSSLDDVIRSSGDHDVIRIGAGNDTVLYGSGDGHDVIEGTVSTTTDLDVLALTDLTPDDVELSRSGTTLLIKVLATGEIIQAQNFFFQSQSYTTWQSYGYGIDSIRFADGTLWNRARIQEEAWHRGGDGRDGLSGSGLDDVFAGGTGDDTISANSSGSVGNDTFVYAMGDGNDVFVETSNSLTEIDTLAFTDIVSSQVRLAYHGDTLLVTVIATGEVIEVADVFFHAENLTTDYNLFGYGIEQIQFADGELWDRQRIFLQTAEDYLGRDFQEGAGPYLVDEVGNVRPFPLGESANLLNNFVFVGIDEYENGVLIGRPDTVDASVVPGHDGINDIDGRGGNDVLMGGELDDNLLGGEGNDILYGDLAPEVEDTSYAGDGNDQLSGGNGDDELHGGGGLDRLTGGAGNDALSGDAGKDYLDDAAGNDTYRGGTGDDIITSGSGSDTFFYRAGDGNDWIDEASSSTSEIDRLVLEDLNASDVTVWRMGSDLFVTVDATGETIEIDRQFSSSTQYLGIERLQFADGTEWDRARLLQEAWYRGGDGRDIIDTSTANDTVVGGTGDDVINSSGGSDAFLYALADGNDWIYDSASSTSQIDRLILQDVDASEVTLSRTATDLFITVNQTGETIEIDRQFASTTQYLGIERLQFADGTEWDRARLLQEAWFRGTNVRDTISTTSIAARDDTVAAGQGDDYVTSNAGNDTFIYAKGDGNDIIVESSGSTTEVDKLILSDLTVDAISIGRSGNDLIIGVHETGETVVVVNQFASTTQYIGIERLQFADGTFLDRAMLAGGAVLTSFVGTFDNDVITGSAAAQLLFGGVGDDVIGGMGGSDSLYGGNGDDRLVISISAAGDLDVIDGGLGFDTLSLSDFGSAVLVDLVTSGGLAQTRDGTTLETGDWRSIATLTSIENVIGTSHDDDILGGGESNDLDGGAGNDELSGRGGNDTLMGGLGSDILTGGLDDDRFVFGVDFGLDTIEDFSNISGNNDVIELSSALFSSFAGVQAAMTQLGDDVVITFDAGDALTLRNVTLASLGSDDFLFVS